MTKETYSKPALSLDQQIKLLRDRGLIVPDEARLKHYLTFIGYFRLQGYCFPFQVDPTQSHIFQPDTTFDDVLNCYIFDRELRLLIMDAIERIEVAVRSSISNTMSLKYGSHWFIDETLFKGKKFHEKFIDLLKKSLKKEKKHSQFIENYFIKYNDPPFPPSWMVAEIMPLGTFSLIYQHIKDPLERKEISLTYGLKTAVMESWLHSLSYLRNLCAHHSRVWNRKFIITPKKMKKYQGLLSDNTRFYAQAVMMYVFKDVIADGSKWQYRLSDLLDKHPFIPIDQMGFPANWKEDPFWDFAQPVPQKKLITRIKETISGIFSKI